MNCSTTGAGSDVFLAIVGHMTQTETFQAYLPSVQDFPFLFTGELVSFQVMAVYGIMGDVVPPFLFAKDTNKHFLSIFGVAHTSCGHGAGGFLIVSSPRLLGTILTFGGICLLI